ncbi:MAG TPA: flippase activity-associated protein Agl23 [Verrucomicrobiae bacterium]|jgi:uncharacterized protein (TIGR03663 family)|nr:flippase activity-associated protein Agl23 [Verrucomicrobiae bacterium]
MSRALIFGLLLALAAALALRCPQLDIRPMHNDEAVNAIKLRTLWEQGSYKYDPQEYHGPTLIYLTFAWMKLIGPVQFAHFDEIQLRLITVIFGVGLILFLPLISDALGRGAIVCAAILIAVSPAMVFYSRYFIHEMLLVAFTFLTIAAGWRYTRNRKPGWAVLAGVSIGLMQATKETFVLSIAAAVAAIFLNKLCNRDPNETANVFSLNRQHLIAAIAAWFITVIVLFTSFFTNARGPLDAVLTYFPWLHRVEGASPHLHPWDYYLSRLIYFHSGRGPVWSEALVLILAIVGIIAAFNPKSRLEGNRKFIRFIALYTIILTAIYSAISYKTPWCLLSFWQGMILLAGVGAMALINLGSQFIWKIPVSCVLLALTVQLAYQAWQVSVPYASNIHNPYIYAQTSDDILNLVERLDKLAPTDAQKNSFVIKVMAPDSEYWPLPWYLRQFKQVGFWPRVPADPYSDAMIVSTAFQANLDQKKTHIMAGLFELRPQTFFELYVETNAWTTYVNGAQRSQ